MGACRLSGAINGPGEYPPRLGGYPPDQDPCHRPLHPATTALWGRGPTTAHSRMETL